MKHISFSSDAFSHSQIKSKIWLSEHFQVWARKYLLLQNTYTLNWYASWVGLGPFILLTHTTDLKLDIIHLYDLSHEDLEVAKKVLNYIECEGVHVVCHTRDVNEVSPVVQPNQIFINTSCEHILADTWLQKIPTDNFICLQSTDMPHSQHTNIAEDLDQFVSRYSPFINILEKEDLLFEYPDKSFKRFMLFGTKK